MNEFYIGFGRADISNDRVLTLNGVYAGGKVLTPICTTCVCLGDGEMKTLIFSNDLRNTTARIAEDIKRMVAEATGVPAERMFIVATHNHTAPDVCLYDRPEMHDYLFRILYPGAVKAAREAVADLAPVQAVSGGRSQVENVAFVRRYFRADGAFAGIVIPKTSNAPYACHETEADKELRAIRFKREGKKDVVLVNFQVHAASAQAVNPESVCADFVHHLREKAEKEDDVLVEYLQGGCGNLNTFEKLPGSPGCNRDYALAGRLIADGLKEALAKAEPLETGALRVQSETFSLFVNHEKTHLAAKAEAALNMIAEKNITDPAEKKRIYDEAGVSSEYEARAIIKRSLLGKTNGVPLGCVSFGDVGITFTPFETFDTNSRQVREASPFKMTFTCGYTNAYCSYLPSLYGFSNGGYETLQCDYLPGSGEAISLELLRLLKN